MESKHNLVDEIIQKINLSFNEGWNITLALKLLVSEYW